jgi:uncharacterized zinc-type alcohol dehydrogenase-like protein
MGIKFAAAMAETIMIQLHLVKAEDAKWSWFQKNAHQGTFDLPLATVPVKHDINSYLSLLKRDSTIKAVGLLFLEPGVWGVKLDSEEKSSRFLDRWYERNARNVKFLWRVQHRLYIEMTNMDEINTAERKAEAVGKRYHRQLLVTVGGERQTNR